MLRVDGLAYHDSADEPGRIHVLVLQRSRENP